MQGIPVGLHTPFTVSYSVSRAGTKKIAWLWPGTTGGDNTETKYENRYFDTEEEALAWLLV